MSFFTKPVSQLTTDDLQQLLQDSAVENVRLEFKSNVPDKDETLKKLSSFANTFGGFMVVGAKANSASGRLEGLSGVDEEAGYKQKIVQWSFDAVSPPLTVEVSDPIPAPGVTGKYCYVAHTAESEIAPHFLNGRKGVWVRTDEFSQRFEPRLATENEIRHLLDRRRLTQDRRNSIIERSKQRFETYVSKQKAAPENEDGGRPAARFELSIGPSFPARPACSQTRLTEALRNCRINWRQTFFPLLNATFLSQHESALFLMGSDARNRVGLVEANIWGMLFYGTELAIELPELGSQAPSGIHLYRVVGHVLAFLSHANRMMREFGYQGALSVDIALTGILGAPWLYAQHNALFTGPVSELDNAFSFCLQTSTDALRERSDGLAIDILRSMLFGMNWADYASNQESMEDLVRSGYGYNFWNKPSTLRL